MKAYKGFNKDMTCKGFQYKEGEAYREDDAKLCEKGFHACENPLDCFNYYAPGQSVYHEVEIDELTGEKSDDTKICGKVIKVGAALDVAGICRAHFEYVKAHTEPAKSNAAGDHESASAGDYGSASAGESGSASAGDYGSASAGDYGSASAGFRGSASAGESGSASAGFRGSASAGESGSASAGDYGSASAGESGVAASRGTAATGKDGVAVAKNEQAKARGGLGALLVIAIESRDDWTIEDYAVGIVDGEKIKADTWYTVKNGEFVEVEDDPSDNVSD